MASFFCGCGARPLQQAGWPRPDAFRFITNTWEGGPVTALPSSLSDSRDKRPNLETNGIDEGHFQQRYSSLLTISILLFHFAVKSDRLLAGVDFRNGS
jgi:hypothetical protein